MESVTECSGDRLPSALTCDSVLTHPLTVPSFEEHSNETSPSLIPILFPLSTGVKSEGQLRNHGGTTLSRGSLRRSRRSTRLEQPSAKSVLSLAATCATVAP